MQGKPKNVLEVLIVVSMIVLFLWYYAATLTKPH
jgi:hypothetical protein